MFDIDELKRVRKKLNLTQKQLAKQAGVSQSLIAKIESGKIDPAYSKAKQIMDTLGSIQNEEERAIDLINRSIISITANDSIKKAIAKMKKYGISQMPVIDTKQAVGLVSEAILLNCLIEGESPDKDVGSVMQDAPPTLTENASQDLVTHMLKEYPIVLISKKGKLVGHITKSDLLQKAFK